MSNFRLVFRDPKCGCRVAHAAFVAGMHVSVAHAAVHCNDRNESRANSLLVFYEAQMMQ